MTLLEVGFEIKSLMPHPVLSVSVSLCFMLMVEMSHHHTCYLMPCFSAMMDTSLWYHKVQ